jgi:hypothetical protein
MSVVEYISVAVEELCVKCNELLLSTYAGKPEDLPAYLALCQLTHLLKIIIGVVTE